MGTLAEHVQKAGENAAFGKGLALTCQANLEWATTSLFYSGLHYIEAFMCKKLVPERHHRDHRTRNTTIQSDSDFRAIRNEYMDLYNLSRDARYRCNAITARTVDSEVIPAFEAVKTYIEARLQ